MSDWWKGAVLYQIYPRSFADSNGDGLGDLTGITKHLDYVKSLGVDGVWLSPIFQSPQADFGYDVSNYRAIDPDYGTMADFDAMLARAHELGLKVLLDIVPSHTSEDHEWFIESLSSRDNPKADWYVWADPKPDGSPPNNWLSVFGGPAWSYHPTRRQYYLHVFYKQQPKLNLHKPEVAEAVFDSIRFWLNKGVDGFRVDVINTCLHDPTLTDNPPLPEKARTAFHWSHAPRLQQHKGDFDWDGNPAFAAKMRAVFDEFEERLVLGEVALPPTALPKYVGGSGLQSGYHFGFLETDTLNSTTVERIYEFLNQHKDVWPCVAFSNHDFARPVTRFGSGVLEQTNSDHAKFLLHLLLSLKGTVLLYQGEELGLPEADVPFEARKDPMGQLYPHVSDVKVRDGCRTPMPWIAAEAHGGFSKATPWLPVPECHRSLAVDLQEADDNSVLSFSRQLIASRRALPALSNGDISVVTGDERLLVFDRKVSSSPAIRCCYNFSDEDVELDMPQSAELIGPVAGLVRAEPTVLKLGGQSAAWLRLP